MGNEPTSPPLPDPYWGLARRDGESNSAGPWFTAEQMWEYARTAIAASGNPATARSDENDSQEGRGRVKPPAPEPLIAAMLRLADTLDQMGGTIRCRVAADDIRHAVRVAAQEAHHAPSRQQQIAAMENLKTDPALLAKLAGEAQPAPTESVTTRYLKQEVAKDMAPLYAAFGAGPELEPHDEAWKVKARAWLAEKREAGEAHPAAAQEPLIRYDVLHEAAQGYGWKYNTLCRVVRDAVGRSWDGPAAAQEGAQEQQDAARLDWIERNLFERKWDGTIGRPSSWHMAGPYRHVLQTMRGESLREAIDAALTQSRK